MDHPDIDRMERRGCLRDSDEDPMLVTATISWSCDRHELAEGARQFVADHCMGEFTIQDVEEPEEDR